MSYKAEILADSISPKGNRLTTMKITFPRMMLAEMNTHRMFSRNSASSRAIPFKKMVKMVEENPFIPIAWQKDHKGMQGTEYWSSSDEVIVEQNVSKMFPHGIANTTWLRARDKAIQEATHLNKTNITKQLCNRLLEPFMWHTVIVTATEWENFFELRCPKYHTPVSGEGFYFRSKKDCIANHSNPENFSRLENMTNLEWLEINKSQADIHIQAIAEMMWDAYNESVPKQLKAGEWHIPYGDDMDLDSTTDKSLLEILSKKLNHTSMAYSEDTEKLAIKIATARCARISYQTLGDNPKIDYEADIRLHDMLAESGHASPMEHIAQCAGNSDWYGNFKGWNQYRKILEKQGLL